MFRALSLGLILALCVPASATAYFSLGGNWNANASWSTVACGGAAAGAFPVSGDTVTLCNGTTTTVNVSSTIGASPADDTGTPAIQCSLAGNATAVLNISAGVTFTYQGTISQCASTWTVGAGATITHDSHLSSATNCNTTPSSCPSYTWRIGAATNCAGACGILVLNGASGNRINVNINASGNNSGGFVCNTTTTCRNGNGLIQATYVNFDHCGPTSSAGYCSEAYPFNTGDLFSITWSKFTNGGKVGVYAPKSSVSWIFNHNTYQSGGNATSCLGGGSGCAIELFTASQPASSPTGSTYQFEHNYVDGKVGYYSAIGQDQTFVIKDNILTGLPVGTPVNGLEPFSTNSLPATMAAGEWDLNILYSQENASTGVNPPAGTLYRTVILQVPNITNLHPVQGVGVSATTFDGVIVDRQTVDPGTKNSGDCFQSINSSVAARAITLKNGIWVVDSGGNSPCTVWNHSAATCNGTTIICPTITVTQNTFLGQDVGTQNSAVGGEVGTGFAGLYTTINSNISWLPASATGWIEKWNDSQTPVANAFTEGNFNVYWNLTDKDVNNKKYSTSTGNEWAAAPGANDTNANPTFISTSRNFLNWGKMCDATVTNWADILSRMAKRNDDSGYNQCFDPANFYNWVKGGYRPQNAAINTAGKSSVRAGAVDWDFAFESSGAHDCGGQSTYCRFTPANLGNNGN